MSTEFPASAPYEAPSSSSASAPPYTPPPGGTVSPRKKQAAGASDAANCLPATVFFSRNDIFIFTAVLLLAAISIVIISVFYSGAPIAAEISVDGQVVGTYPLNVDTVIDVPGFTGHIVQVTISDKAADVTEADCPNQICADHAPISNTGETIVCLPNRVIVRIISHDDH